MSLGRICQLYLKFTQTCNIQSIIYIYIYMDCIFQKLINAETAIYDVLQDFFWHSNSLVRMAGLEVR
jgi:hypothetical protein